LNLDIQTNKTTNKGKGKKRKEKKRKVRNMSKTSSKTSSKTAAAKAKAEAKATKANAKALQVALFADPSDEIVEVKIDDEIKSYTKLPDYVLGNLTKEGNEAILLMKGMGIPGEDAAKKILEGFLEKQSEMKDELVKQIEKEIKEEKFHEVVHAVGRGKYMYAKFVDVDGFQSLVDQKKFNSERACRQWLKVKKIRGLI
jgi:hypothetical protein